MTYTDSELDVITADSLNELTYQNKKLLLASESNENGEAQKYADALIKTVGVGVYNKIKEKFRDETYRREILKGLDKAKVGCVTINSRGYPPLLKEIDYPPLVLYYRGNAELLNGELFAVVGSRRTTRQMLEACGRICGELSKKLTLVTGVADGADSAVISSGLKSGKIICVIPGGHSSFTPSNPNLISEVEKVGLVISECPPTEPALRHTFVLRNRIIAGMSKGTLVVSAPLKSGALSTASFATDYSREVFAFPYGLGVFSGEGCNDLIKNGAYLCENSDDILSVLGYRIDKKDEKQPDLSPEESAVLTALKEEGELHAERIAGIIGKRLTEVLTVCTMLEIKGLIVRTGGNKFSALK